MINKTFYKTPFSVTWATPLLLLLLLLLLMMMMLMLIILELIKAPHLNTTIQGAPHSFLYPFIKSLLFQKIIYFFCFSLAFKRPIFHWHHPASRQMSNQGTQILFILPFTNLRLKKTFLEPRRMPLIIIRSGPGTRASNHPPLTPLTSGNKTLYNFPVPPSLLSPLPAFPPSCDIQ